MHFDISPILSSQTAVFPGDRAFHRKVEMSFSGGQHLDLSSIETTVHVGAHADAPSHYGASGETIEKRDLSYYLGGCQVVSVKAEKSSRLNLSHIDLNKISEKRVLFKTNSFPNPFHWNNDFNSLSPELIEALFKKGVKLVGIDTPSIDPWDSKQLESHNQILKCNMAILEGVILHHVPDGVYKIIALPLPILGGDASPVRAILVPPQDWDLL